MADLIQNLLYNCFSDLRCVESAGENAEKLLQFKRWFWSIVEKMSMTERQDLVRHYSLKLLIFECECEMICVSGYPFKLTDLFKGTGRERDSK